MTFGLWWGYFVIPHGHLLSAHRERSFGWGYEQMLLFGALVAVGAGLHVAAYHLGDDYDVSSMTTVWSVAIPLGAYLVGLYGLYAADHPHPRPVPSAAGRRVRCGARRGIAMAAAGVPMVWCVLVLALTPWVSVVGYEAVGHRHNERVLASLERD